MWEHVRMETSFTVWACPGEAEQKSLFRVWYPRGTERGGGEKGSDPMSVWIYVCVLSAEKEWEVRTAVFLQREASIFRPSVGMWEMSASNWDDKTVLSFRRKYGFQHKGATALDNSHWEVHQEWKVPPLCVYMHTPSRVSWACRLDICGSARWKQMTGRGATEWNVCFPRESGSTNSLE